MYAYRTSCSVDLEQGFTNGGRWLESGFRHLFKSGQEPSVDELMSTVPFSLTASSTLFLMCFLNHDQGSQVSVTVEMSYTVANEQLKYSHI